MYASNRVKLITFFFVLLILLMSSLIFIENISYDAVFVLFVIVVLFTLTFIKTPRKIYLSDKSMILYFYLSRKIFILEQIHEISRIYAVGGIRRLGSNGVLGYIGVLDGEKRFFTYFNHERNMIKLKYNDRYYIISCDNPDALIGSIKNIQS